MGPGPLKPHLKSVSDSDIYLRQMYSLYIAKVSCRFKMYFFRRDLYIRSTIN